MPDSSPPPVPSPTTTPARTFLSVDLCSRHGFAMLAMATLDDSGNGGGRRLLGPKSCCPERRELVRWQVSPADLARIAGELAPSAPPAPAPATELDEWDRLAREVVEARAAYEATPIFGWGAADQRTAAQRKAERAELVFVDYALPRVAQLVAAARRGMEDGERLDVLEAQALQDALTLHGGFRAVQSNMQTRGLGFGPALGRSLREAIDTAFRARRSDT